LSLPPEDSEALPWVSSPTRWLSFAGIHGPPERSQLGRLAGPARLGSIQFENPLVSIKSGTPKLGARLLLHLALTFDQRRGRLYVQRPTSPLRQPPERGIGAAFAKLGERWVVADLVPDGPAQRAGLRIGDTVLLIGDADPEALACGGLERLLRDQDRIDIVLRRRRQTIRHTVPVVESHAP
jgi:hypothetical protein